MTCLTCKKENSIQQISNNDIKISKAINVVEKKDSIQFPFPISSDEDLLVGAYRFTFDISLLSSQQVTNILSMLLDNKNNPIQVLSKEFQITDAYLTKETPSKLAIEILITKNPFPILWIIAALATITMVYLTLDKIEKIMEVSTPVFYVGVAVVCLALVYTIMKK